MYCNSTLVRKCSIVLLLFLSKAFSAEITTSIDKQSLTVGDVLTLKVTTVVPKGAVVTPPSFDSNIGNVVVKEWNSFKKESDNSDSITFSYKITTYIPEACTIPSLPYLVQQGEKQDTLLSKSLPLELQSVITAETVDIKDMKPQLDTGRAPLWWLWVLIFAALTAAAVFIYKKYFKKNAAAKDITVPLLPPYEEAIAAIHELERQKYLIRGLIREYVFDLSEILKRYIERRFSVNASEFTTEEMIAWLGVSGLDSKHRQSVDWFFRTSDPVKFARLVPDQASIDRFMKETMDFLNATRPLLQETTAAPADKTAVAIKSPETSLDSSKPAAPQNSLSDTKQAEQTGENNAV